MAKLTVGKGLDKYIGQLEALNSNTPEILGRSIYPGAKIVADAVKANIEKLPVSNKPKRGTSADPIDTITSAQKQGLRDGFGISDMQKQGGYLNVKLGFAGYNSQISDTSKSRKYKNPRQPNVLIARAVENGTSFRKKHPFVSPAVRSTKAAAEKAMAEELDKEIAKKMQ